MLYLTHVADNAVSFGMIDSMSREVLHQLQDASLAAALDLVRTAGGQVTYCILTYCFRKEKKINKCYNM